MAVQLIFIVVVHHKNNVVFWVRKVLQIFVDGKENESPRGGLCVAAGLSIGSVIKVGPDGRDKRHWKKP